MKAKVWVTEMSGEAVDKVVSEREQWRVTATHLVEVHGSFRSAIRWLMDRAIEYPTGDQRMTMRCIEMISSDVIVAGWGARDYSMSISAKEIELKDQ